ncbi:hypothetical protein CB0940_06226 [Cercospora beticola]|uniref:DUF7820 domain-containing protein n=1 Tax=Cercospora beticola TaxID=122368 RepID=A0A2G5HZS9_CERBT|nr:hypothetical protein CB0940_06226 [Cercospora beticola]PIA97742.1 hypothetical protein CB0940_06226 [Cercospora beticola]CAK1360124.1 unnamed protein product [Cercospora beticola]
MAEQRRSLLDGSATPTQERADVFSDEHEVEDDEFAWDGIADGFRPNVDRDEGVPDARQEEVDGQPIRSVSAHYAPGNVTPTMGASSNRNSTRKSRTYPNPFSSPEDEPAPAQRNLSLEFERDDAAVRRSISSVSSSQFAPTHSPRFGAGPSHPYQIYPQTAVGRTLSNATQSTVVAPSVRQSYSNNVPAHPYAMYPQGVTEDMDDEEDTDDFGIRQQNPVTVGFPGLGQNYTRRLGPDGEDQDLIGEDGHTEQLPPYTRYPEDAPEKAPLLMPTAPTALLSRAPVAGTDPSMPLMHTMIQPSPTPAPQSMTDESALRRPSSRSSTNLLMHSDSSSENLDKVSMHKTWKEKSWKEKRKTRMCGFGKFKGVAFQWILVVICVLVFVAALLGGVIGGFVAGGEHARNSQSITVVTSLYDASLIASPTSGAPPTGTYALTLGAPQETQSDCLSNKGQRVAWDCDLAPNSALAMVVRPSPQGLGAVLQYASYDSAIAYGAQLSYMNTSFAQFLTVQDQDDKQNGPAFYFQQFYDKVVVVPEAALTTSSGSKRRMKRGWYSPGWKLPEAWASRKQLATPGEKPWFCVWNETLLEGFIYVTESLTTSTSTIPTSTSSTKSSTSPPSAPASITPPPTTSDTGSYDGRPPFTGYPPGDQIITKTISAPMTTATYTGPASKFDGWTNSIMDDAKRRLFQASADPHMRRGDDDYVGQDFWSTLEVFPFLVKLEERRVGGAPSPYCQQYQILDDGRANWVSDPDSGKPIVIQLDEDDPEYGKSEITSKNRAMMFPRGVPNACHCQWMSGEGPL